MFQVYDDLMFKPAWPVLFSVAPYLSPKDRISLGPGVVNPYHSHPSLIAANFACLAEETQGRSFLMIGKGAFHDLFEVETQRPLRAISESVKIIHGILSGDMKDFRGSVFSARREAGLRWSSSYQGGCPPIWIGTWGPKTCEPAGRMREISGVMVSSITDVRYIRFLRQRVEAGARSSGRDPDEVELGCVPGTIVSEDREKALRLAREASAVYLPYLDPMPDYLGIPKEEVRSVRAACSGGDLESAARLVSDKAVDSFKLWGTPDDIIDKISKLYDGGRGVDRINFGFGRGPEDIGGIELLGRKVLPYFRG
jgi:5,10-methylenetetrahydromethanopterin reductase